jgi:hypothetical protein
MGISYILFLNLAVKEYLAIYHFIHLIKITIYQPLNPSSEPTPAILPLLSSQQTQRAISCAPASSMVFGWGELCFEWSFKCDYIVINITSMSTAQ